MEGELTGQNICNHIKDLLSNWNNTLDRVQVFFCEIMQEALKSTNKTKNLTSCSGCEYKVELNISYARETEKAKIKCPVLFG